eukprot:15469971-Alexandrium_andersonii.AAC.1
MPSCLPLPRAGEGCHSYEEVKDAACCQYYATSQRMLEGVEQGVFWRARVWTALNKSGQVDKKGTVKQLINRPLRGSSVPPPLSEPMTGFSMDSFPPAKGRREGGGKGKSPEQKGRGHRGKKK